MENESCSFLLFRSIPFVRLNDPYKIEKMKPNPKKNQLNNFICSYP